MSDTTTIPQADWIGRAGFGPELDEPARAVLADQPSRRLPAGTVLFRPGDPICGFVIVVSGRIGIYLTGASGRDIRLYDINNGETCVQSTLGLLGNQDYAGEAIAETDIEVVIVQKADFVRLLDVSPAFRRFVFQAFAERFSSVMSVIERVAFVKIETRLAETLVERADADGIVRNTHQELATAIGSAREVVSRRLEAFRKKGLVELDRGEIRIADRDGTERDEKLGRVKDAEVLRLRGQLLPLVRLRETLGCLEAEGPIQGNATGATNIIVVDTGQTRFGLVVDALHDSEEIVVKPLGRHHKECRQLAGATILGDGHVALILDIAGIAADEDLRSDEELREKDADHVASAEDSEDKQSMLLFQNNEQDRFAVPMDIVARIERVRVDQIDSVAGQEVLQYKNTTLPLMRLESCITASAGDFAETAYVVVYEVRGREVGLIAPHLEDIREVSTNVDTVTFRESGVIGSLVINEHTVRLIDLFEMTQMSHPDWFQAEEGPELDDDGLPPLILLAEDSGFFRSQVTKIFEEKGYRVSDHEDGQLAWDWLDAGAERPNVIVTDIEMPNLNGFDLCHRVKNDPRFAGMPVIALTSLAGSADIQRGMDVGIDDYQIKMDRDKLLTAVQNFAGQANAGRAP